jgi:hypothetical protein
MIDYANLTYLPGTEPGTPEWWLKRLLARLHDRQWLFQRYDRYYDGEQPLALWSNKLRDRFGERFGSEEFSSNFMALVVDRTRERFEVQGFRFEDKEGDADLWDIWQSNNLDAGSQLAHTEALIKGIAYTLIEPALDNGTPTITIEDPCDTIIETGPKGNRLAGLKRWIDDDGHLVVYVYLPDYVYTFRSDQSVMTVVDASWLAQAKFSRYDVPGEEWPLVNKLGVVPLVALPYRPRLRKFGQSELEPVIPNQNAIDFYKASAIVAALYVAYPQRWVLNLDAETDSDTGAEKEPFQAGMASLWRVPPPDPDDPNPPPVSFGQFAPGSLEPYMTAIETEVGHISSISGMPYHYLLGQPSSVPPSGESLKSSEAGLVSKVGAASIHLGEGWEETMRVALIAMGDARSKIRNAETIWADPETRNEAVRTDSIIKQFTAKIIDRQTALEALGYSPEQIDRMVVAAAPPAEVVEVVPAPTGPRMSA